MKILVKKLDVFMIIYLDEILIYINKMNIIYLFDIFLLYSKIISFIIN